MVERDLSGSVLDGRYRLLSLLGKGGMGQVYVGKHLLLSRRVAVKILPEQLSADARFRARFAREARAACTIAHLNVVQVLDFGESSDGPAYIVMELLEGKDLRDLLRKAGRLPWPRARHILLQAVSALKAAHAHDIVHRDIKPGNCFVIDLPHEGLTDVVKLLDFGIAKVLTELESDGLALVKPLTGTGEIMGTASYMAPEQARGQPLDARSDIYSLGIMAYEMLTGRVPFAGSNPLDVISRHLHAPPPPLRRLARDILPEVEALVLRTLAKDPRDRFASMTELEAALLAIPGPSLATVRSRVFSSSGAVVQASAGDVGIVGRSRVVHQPGHATEELATEPEHQGITPRFGSLPDPRAARHAERKALGASGGDDTGGSRTPSAGEAAEAHDPMPTRARGSIDLRSSQATTKVRRRTAPPAADAVDPAAATAMDLAADPRRAAAVKPRRRAQSPRPTPGRRRPQSAGQGDLRSRGATIARSLGVVLLLGCGVTVTSMAFLDQKKEPPAMRSAKGKIPAETEASIVTAQADHTATSSAPTSAKLADTEPHELPALPIADSLKEADSSTEPIAVVPPAPVEPPYKSDECRKQRSLARRAKDGGNYGMVARHTRQRSCWGPNDQTAYLRLRVEALVETSRSEECIRLGQRSKDPVVIELVDSCR